MCEPVAIASAVIAVAGSAMQSSAAATEARDQQAFNEAMRARSAQQQKLNTELALESYARQQNAENLRLGQEDATATEQVMQANIRAARASAEARVDATHAGVTGASIAGLFDEYSRENSRYTEALRTSRANDEAASSLRKEGFQAEAQNRILSFEPYMARPVSEPSLFGSLLKIGAAGAGGYMSMSKWNPRGSTGVGSKG
jgi:hypothetical protein